MTVDVPRYVGDEAGGWHVVDVLTAANRASVNAARISIVRFPVVDGGRRWSITRAAIMCTGTVTPEPQLRGYVVPAGTEDFNDVYLRTGTDRGLYDEADYPGDGLIVDEDQQLAFMWTGGIQHEIATATLQYRLLGR